MKTSKYIIYALTGLLALSIILCVSLVAYSSFELASSGSLKTQLDDYKKKAEESSKYESYYQRWKSIEKEFAFFKDEYLMKMEDFSLFRDQVISLIQKNRLKEDGISYRYKIFSKDITKVEVTSKVIGTYSDIKQLLYDFVTQRKIILVQRVEIEKDKREEFIIGKFLLEVYLVN